MNANLADEIIERLGLRPHPEGGAYAETWRHAPGGEERGAGSAIYYLLRAGEESRWHRVDAAEVWHYYAGAPLELRISEKQGKVERVILGPDVLAGERPQVVVPANAWQSARPLGAFTLTGCTVSPAFRFDGFEMAPKDWEP